MNDHYDSADTTNDSDQIIVPFKNLVNDAYCRDISIKIRSQLDVKRKNGQFIGSFAGYGYQKDPENKNHLIIDEYAADIVRYIFNLKMDGYSSQRIAEKLNEKVAEGMINISMNTAPYFENGASEGNVMIVNESINNYPQQVEFIRNDTGEQIYQSKAIPVGSKIERAALDVELPAGTYECTAMFHNLDPVSGEIIGTAGAIITITIQH